MTDEKIAPKVNSRAGAADRLRGNPSYRRRANCLPFGCLHRCVQNGFAGAKSSRARRYRRQLGPSLDDRLFGQGHLFGPKLNTFRDGVDEVRRRPIGNYQPRSSCKLRFTEIAFVIGRSG